MKNIRYTALASKVLVVCITNYDDKILFDWTCYIDAVPGIKHDNEYLAVAGLGAKLSQKVAAVLYPDLDIEKYRL